MNLPEISYFQVSNGVGIYSPPEARALIQEIWEEDRYLRHAKLAPGDIVLDIGANVGIFSTLAAYRGATVIAIEPNPYTFSLLERNIQENGFGPLVTPLNMAVSDRAGVIELAIPEMAKLYSLGSATTSAGTMRQLESMPEISMRKVTVKCAPIGEILASELPEGAEISFLKMDCEGAEWAVLESMGQAVARRIRSMALETHRGYAEIDLVRRLEGLGYRITGFEKRSGSFQTGFIYATLAEARECPPAAKGAFAVLVGPRHSEAGRPATFSSEGSFGLPLESGKLTREWFVDGTPAGEGNEITVNSQSAGIRSIALQVEFGNVTERTEIKMIALEKDYFESGKGACVLQAKETRRVEVEGAGTFRIPAEALPGDWSIDGVMVSIFFADGFDRNHGARIHFMGNAIEIESGYTQMALPFPSNALDVIFSLEAETRSPVDLSWWPYREEGASPAPAPSKDSLSGAYLLPGPSMESVLVPEEFMRFCIGRDSLPTSWTPKVLKIGISSLPCKGPLAPKLAGHLGFRENRFDLAGWYTETALLDFSAAEDTIFEIRSPAVEKLKIVWWGE